MISLNSEVQEKVLDEYVTRKVLLHQDSMMLVEFTFKKGGIGQPHSHEEHEQVGYIAEGVFEVTVGDQTKTLSRGDSYYAAKNEVHGVVALEDGIIIDAFTPIRKDFL
ncbi:Cupin domain protein [Novipirellula aureliae]|uniref:Cupin domain protein n=1 Tax=Novipirellula aureliae TaxID=2527966 RepID=A0A5C6DVQ2_9BACT|nr:cupin domain-containing protein [Novipirellula aureliae]TWU38889.1 Cupin domain protein [Novipirellula aureliae]